MTEKKSKMIYYISDITNGIVYIVDSERYKVIKKFEIGHRPENIILDSRKYAYIASDRNSKITVIDDSLNIYKALHIPNNGNLQVDFENEKIYVSNTDEVCIYNLKNEEKINTIKGFTAAECLRLSSDKKYIFILDVLQNVIKVYDTIKFKLTAEYRNIGNSPQYIYIEEGGNYLYAANKNIDKRKKAEDISVIEIQTGKTEWINLEGESSISCLEQRRGFLYALNNRANKIHIIDISERKCIASIETTLKEVQKIKLSPDKTVLILSGKTVSGKGAIEKYDTSTNALINTFVFYEKDTTPYEIAIASIDKNLIKHEKIVQKSNSIYYSRYRESHIINILAKIVVSSYSERTIFNKVKLTVSSPVNKNKNVRIERIIFCRCRIIDESKNMEYIYNKYNNLIFEYYYLIPYSVYCIDENNEKYIVEGKIKGSQKAKMHIPDYIMQKDIEFVINSYTKLIKDAVIKNNTLVFSANAIISTKAVVEEEIQTLDYGQEF